MFTIQFRNCVTTRMELNGRPTNNEQRFLSILSKITSLLGTLGALWIVIDILSNKDKRKRSKERLLFVVSVTDLIQSTSLFFGTWAMPADTQIYGALGSQTTCNIQGFLLIFSNVCTSLYSACFGIYFLLLAISRWDVSPGIEIFMHVFNLTWSLIASTVGLFQKSYNPSVISCFLSKWPLECSGDECIRGDKNVELTKFFVGFSMITSYVIYCPALIMIYCAISKEMEISVSNDPVRLTIYRTIQRQALQYLGAFYLTFTFPIIIRVYHVASKSPSIVISILAAIFYPLKGFLNALIYKQVEISRFWKRFRIQSKSNEVTREPIILSLPSVENISRNEENTT